MLSSPPLLPFFISSIIILLLSSSSCPLTSSDILILPHQPKREEVEGGKEEGEGGSLFSLLFPLLTNLFRRAMRLIPSQWAQTSSLARHNPPSAACSNSSRSMGLPGSSCLKRPTRYPPRSLSYPSFFFFSLSSHSLLISCLCSFSPY